jgi:hypothetical protein
MHVHYKIYYNHSLYTNLYWLDSICLLRSCVIWLAAICVYLVTFFTLASFGVLSFSGFYMKVIN